MNMQRKLTLMIATGAVALGAGHIVQRKAADRTLAHEGVVIVTDVEPVAAGPQTEAQPIPAIATVPMPAPVAALPVEQAPVLPVAAEAAPDPVLTPDAVVELPAEPDCTAQLQLIPQPGAMIGLSLLAPCHPGERVVLRHAGMAVTGKTSESGALFGALPALATNASVKVRFASGDEVAETISMPDAANYSRFIVQWQDEDAFQLHAFENGAGYGQPGHLSAALMGSPAEGDFISLLGDSSTELPLLAEAYSFANGKASQVVLEAAVTETTCNREILGETIMAEGGKVEIADLTLAMPGCDAIGDILVLKNLMQDMKLAAAN